jgi:hypothetical protein
MAAYQLIRTVNETSGDSRGVALIIVCVTRIITRRRWSAPRRPLSQRARFIHLRQPDFTVFQVGYYEDTEPSSCTEPSGFARCAPCGRDAISEPGACRPRTLSQ